LLAVLLLALAFCERNELTKRYLRAQSDLVLPVAEIRALGASSRSRSTTTDCATRETDRAAADPEIPAGLQ
jgi:hypothetical protein